MGMSLEMILNICLVILIKAFELFIFSMITPVTNEKQISTFSYMWIIITLYIYWLDKADNKVLVVFSNIITVRFTTAISKLLIMIAILIKAMVSIIHSHFY